MNQKKAKLIRRVVRQQYGNLKATYLEPQIRVTARFVPDFNAPLNPDGTPRQRVERIGVTDVLRLNPLCGRAAYQALKQSYQRTMRRAEHRA